VVGTTQEEGEEAWRRRRERDRRGESERDINARKECEVIHSRVNPWEAYHDVEKFFVSARFEFFR
jgi:hypothetical protein